MAEPHYAPRLRPERLIAAGRVVLAVSSLFAVWLDVDEPVRYAPVAYTVLVGYMAYALASSALLWRAESVPRWWPLVTHALDLLCFSLFIFFTEGPASPFTVYLVFALLSATLRWQARGTLWTAVVVIAAFLGFGFYFGVVIDDPGFDLRALIIRGVYLVVLAALLSYVGTQDQRTLREMWGLASWPQTVRGDAASLVHELLAYAARLLAAPKVVLVWAEIDSPRQQMGIWEGGRWSHERRASQGDLVHEEIRDRAFIYAGVPVARTLVQEISGPQLVPWAGQPVDPSFAQHFNGAPILSVPIRGESFEGRLFLSGQADSTLDGLILAEIIAGVIAGRLEAFYLVEELRQSAATEERIRLARDLHDGALQSFTGIALRLAAIRRLLDIDTAAAAVELQDVQRVLAAEQRDLRFFIQDLTPSTPRAETAPLQERFGELSRRMEREWDLRVEWHVDLPAEGLPAALSHDLYHIVREALVNAARHGGASAARVDISPREQDALAVAIQDDGRGFPFAGRYSADDLVRLNFGPKTLRERVRDIRGSLVLESGATGARLNIVLPRSAAA